MKLELTDEQMPARVHFDLPDGSHGRSVVVYQYSDGKVLTASALVLDPESWAKAEVSSKKVDRTGSPPWAQLTADQVTDYFRERSHDGLGLGRFVEGLDEAVERERQADRRRMEESPLPPVEPVPPKSVTKILPEDDVPYEEVLGLEKQ